MMKEEETFTGGKNLLFCLVSRYQKAYFTTKHGYLSPFEGIALKLHHKQPDFTRRLYGIPNDGQRTFARNPCGHCFQNLVSGNLQPS
jgi:hypothetical protein